MMKLPEQHTFPKPSTMLCPLRVWSRAPRTSQFHLTTRSRTNLPWGGTLLGPLPFVTSAPLARVPIL